MQQRYQNCHGYTEVINVTANYPDMYLSFYPHNKDNSGAVAFFDEFSLTFNSGAAAEPGLLNMADYYPHGSVMPGLNYNSSYKYRYGYQGQFAEMDDESNESNFELRNYDGLLGRFKTIDPYGQYWSPYMAMGNSHPNTIDMDGGEGLDWFKNVAGEVRWFDEAPDADLGWTKVGDINTIFPGGNLPTMEVITTKPISESIGIALFGSSENFNAIKANAGGDNQYMPPNLTSNQWQTTVDAEKEIVLWALPVGEVFNVAAKTFRSFEAWRAARIARAGAQEFRSLGAASKGFSKIPKGFKQVKNFGYQHGQKVYKYEGKFYSRDIDAHNGGVWKVFEQIKGKLKRIGTADENLNIFKD